MSDLVSIVTPVYNAEQWLEETIQSVRAQTYQNWEWYLVDDRSTDNSTELISKYVQLDKRIHLLENDKNSGAAVSRNHGLKHSVGDYLAYIDADDLWDSRKLEKQVAFMQENHAPFSCTSYRVLSEEGKSLNKEIHMLPKVDYVGFLTNNLLQTVGIMVDLNQVNRKHCVMPDLRRRQDAATWLQILKAGFDCYGMAEPLAGYRRTQGSLSSNKVKAVKGVWFLYRKVEKLNWFFACYCFARYASLAVWKRVYR